MKAAAPAASASSSNPSAQPLSGEQAKRWSEAVQLDYAAIGFRCGLEIHQQLDTGKLFSRVRSEVLDAEQIQARTIAEVTRVLRVTGSEVGTIDAAAQAESRRNRRFRYLAVEGLTSLVELDEEPPKPLDRDALGVALTFAGLAASRPVDEIQVMRKTVIDGSNTSGFQRTALVATGGRLEVDGGGVGLWTIALEEDSARPIDERDGVATYSLDRLGIPLIEIATAPDLKDPQHAQRAAARIGGLLRTTGRVKRGLGTIRQDLNVSVGVGARVEVKGCQDLRALPRVIEAECRRQLWMHHVAEELRRRAADAAGIGAPLDVTAAFEKTDAKMVHDAVGKGAKVLGLRLPGFAGLLKGSVKDGPRLGRELADHAKVAANVNGILHSDELPAYGISPAEVAAVRGAIKCGEQDAFVLCVEKERTAQKALAAVAERARQATAWPAKEVRGVQPDDSTRFMRPMPGAARMYPETDVPPIRVTAETWRAVVSDLPPKPEEKVQLLVKQHGLNVEIAKQLVADGWDSDFQRLVAADADAALVARILLQHLAALKDPDRVLPHLAPLVAALRAGRFSKEAIPDILAALDAGAEDVERAIAAAGAGAADLSAVDAVIAKVIAERKEFVRSKGMDAVGPLMGPVMAELRGKADGAVISARLKAAIAKAAK